MATRFQERQRLSEAIVGTALMAGLLSLFRPSREDHLDDGGEGAYIHVTGAGPDNSDPAYRDAWRKRHKSFALEVDLGGKEAQLNYGRGFGESFLFPLSVVGAYDDHLIRERHNEGKSRPVDLWMPADLAANYLGTLQQRGAFIGLKNAGDLFTRMGNAKAPVIAGTATSLAANLIPFNRLFQTAENFFIDQPDKSSVRAAVYANLPVVPAVASKPALNALGDPIGDETISGKGWFGGAPAVLRVPRSELDERVYGLIREKGQGPPMPTRANIETKYGPVSDQEWHDFVKSRGEFLKDGMDIHYSRLLALEPHDFDEKLTRMAAEAEKKAARDVGLLAEPKPKRRP